MIRNTLIPKWGGKKSIQEINLINSPATARVHVSQEDENVVENFQMCEHPDRWGESDGESEPVRSLQTLEWWRGNWLPHETSNIRGGGSEMEPLSSLQEIICLIKDFPPSCSLDQSEVFAPERGWNDQGTLGLQGRATVRSLPPEEDLLNPVGKVQHWSLQSQSC